MMKGVVQMILDDKEFFYCRFLSNKYDADDILSYKFDWVVKMINIQVFDLMAFRFAYQ